MAEEVTEVASACPACGGSGEINGGPCPDCYDPSHYGAEKDYDAIDYGPVPETDPAVVEALYNQQLKELHEAGFE